MTKVLRLLAELRIPAGWEETLQFLVEEAGYGTLFAGWDFPSGAVGDEASLEDRAADRLVVVLEPARAEAFGAQMAAWAGDFGWGEGAYTLRIEEREVEEDLEAWQRHWRPFRCAGFEIRAAFHDPAAVPHRAGCQPLVVEAGSAFGTGTHATTRSMLRALREELQAETASAVLDVGTGSGILAVAAALLGVPQVAGMDPDPASAPQARRSAAANGVAGRCRFWQGRLESAAGAWPLVLANLVADLHELHAGALLELTTPGGRLIAAGVREDRLAETRRAFEDLGAACEGAFGRGRWRGLRFRSPLIKRPV